MSEWEIILAGILGLLAMLGCGMQVFGGGASKATTTSADRRIAAEGSKIAAEGSQFTESGAIAIGSGSQFLEAGSIGRDLAARDITITSSDPDLLMHALDVYRDLSGQTSAVLSDANRESQFILGESLEGLRGLKQVEMTAGQTLANRFALVIVLAGLGLVAFIFWRKK